MSRNAIILAALSFVLLLVEWALFELIRIPYRPPDDMRTLLGTEKAIVLEIMVMIGVCGSAFLFTLLLTLKLSLKDYLLLIAIISALLAVVTWIVRYPAWQVTPWELLFN